MAETTSLLNWRTGNRTGGSNPPLTAERKPQVVEKQTLAALFVSWKLHGNCTEFFTDLQKIPIWGGSNGFLPHFYRCWMSGFSPLFTAVLTAVYSGWSIPFFSLRAILIDRKCTDLHYGIGEKNNYYFLLDYSEILFKERLQLLYNSLPFLLSGNRYFLRNKSTKMIRSAR